MKADLAADLSPPPKKRLTLDLTPEDVARLERLQKRLGARSKAACLRYALQLYESILDHREKVGEAAEIDPSTLQLYWVVKGQGVKVRVPTLR